MDTTLAILLILTGLLIGIIGTVAASILIDHLSPSTMPKTELEEQIDLRVLAWDYVNQFGGTFKDALEIVKNHQKQPTQ